MNSMNRFGYDIYYIVWSTLSRYKQAKTPARLGTVHEVRTVFLDDQHRSLITSAHKGSVGTKVPTVC